MDVASLGLAVDSSQADKGTVSLNKLTGAAYAAQKAATGLAGSNRATAGAAAQVASSANAAAAALNSQAGAANRTGAAMRAANDNVMRMGGGVSGLAAQFQDIGVTAAAGMHPVLIALQQGTQIAGQMEAAMQAGGSATAVLGTALRSLLSPVTFITIGLVALVAAGLQMVDWAGLAASVVRGLASILEEIAPYAAAAAAGLALLYAPTIVGGIVQIIALLGRMAVTAVTAAAAMAAANPLGAFVLGISAAVVAANIFRDELAGIFDRDIVVDAKNGVNFVIAAFVGAFNGIKATWSLLPGVVGDITTRAVNAHIAGIETMINTAIKGINKVIEFARSAGVNLSTIGNVDLGRLENSNAGAAQAAADAMGQAIRDARGTDYVGEFTSAVTSGASAAAEKLNQLANSFGGVDKAADKAAKRAAKNYAEIVLGAQQFVAAQEMERQALGMTEVAAARARHEQELFNKAANDNITLTPQQTAELKGLAASMGEAEVATSRMQQAFQFGKGVFTGFFENIRQGIREGEGLWGSFKNAALSALDTIMQKALEMAASKVFTSLFSGFLGGGGGFFGSLFGGLFAKGGVFTRGEVTPFATGGVVTRPTLFPMGKGAGLMGEAGPEAIMPLRRGRGGRLGVESGSAPVQPALVRVEVVSGEMFEARVTEISGDVSAKVVKSNNKAVPAMTATAQKRFG